MDMSDAVAEAILSTRSDAIVAADRHGIIGFWNPAAVKKSFDAMLEAEAKFKDDLEKLVAAESKMLLRVVVLPQPLLGRTPWPRSTSCCC